MKQKKIRLNEADLHRIIKKAINEITNDEQGNDENMFEYYKQFYKYQIECSATLQDMLDSDRKIPSQVANKIYEIDNQIEHLYFQIGYILANYYPGIMDCGYDENLFT